MPLISAPRNDNERVWIENSLRDAALREAQTLQYIRADNEIYTTGERKRLKEARVLQGMFKLKGVANMTSHRSNLSNFKAKFFQGEAGVFVNVEYLLRASIDNIAAFLMDPCASHHNKTEAERRVLSRSSHGIVSWSFYASPYEGIVAREVVSQQIWFRQSANEILVVAWPTKHEAILENKPGVVRGELSWIWRLKQKDSGTAEVEFSNYLGAGGDNLLDTKNKIATWVAKSYILGQTISREEYKMAYFQHVKEEHHLRKVDGSIMAELLMNDSIKERDLAGMRIFGVQIGGWRHKYDFSSLAVDRFCKKNAGIRAVIARSGGWFPAMLKEVCWNHVYPVKKVTAGLKELGVDDGRRMGRSYAMTILSNTSFEAAADEFIHFYPALGEVDRQYIWFRPMMVTLAKLAQKQSKFGLYWRACLGAGLSTMDMISDIYIISVFFAEGNDTYAYANIAMIAANWLFQLLVVWLQTGKNIVGSAFLKDAFITTVGLKPGIDALRVCQGREQQPGQTWDAISEVR